MKHFLSLSALFFLAAVLITAQENLARDDQRSSSYLIPQTIFVGDRARLVVPLGQVFSKVPSFIRANPEFLYKTQEERAGLRHDIVINRIELEHRSGIPRLHIDFVPYIPGVIIFPPITIPENSSLEISGLRVTVASILKPDDSSLEEPAAPLATPGTGILIYSTMASLLVVFFLCIGGSIWGKHHFVFYKRRFYRRRLIRAMDRLLKRLYIECIGGANIEELFSILSGEFREFLSFFTRVDCMALTAGEFGSLDFPVSEAISGDYLYKLFSRLENIRFGGSQIGKKHFLEVLSEFRSFIVELGRAERSASIRETAKKETANEEIKGALA
ncbi:MAG: hypothetical protein LBH43_08245 [Treponema sp.]|jgi:hypothetical protein|nr:hypothetical protein [Treponema sp.]